MRGVLATIAAAMILVGRPVRAQSQADAAPGDTIFQDRSLSSWIADLKALAPVTRSAAAYAISSMGPAAKPAVPALIEALQNENEIPAVLYPIEVALREIGPAAEEAVPELEQMADYRNEDVAHMARKAIKAIEASNP